MKKLMNKKTGEVAEFVVHKRIEDSEDGNQVYAPFEFNPEEWEEYAEPKEYWYINSEGEIGSISIEADGTEGVNASKSIGNYFETREEAEKAVEKLKAWKRLKDEYDFKFTGWKRDDQFRGDFIITAQDWNTSDDKLLDLLFGGEE